MKINDTCEVCYEGSMQCVTPGPVPAKLGDMLVCSNLDCNTASCITDLLYPVIRGAEVSLTMNSEERCRCGRKCGVILSDGESKHHFCKSCLVGLVKETG